MRGRNSGSYGQAMKHGSTVCKHLNEPFECVYCQKDRVKAIEETQTNRVRPIPDHIIGSILDQWERVSDDILVDLRHDSPGFTRAMDLLVRWIEVNRWYVHCDTGWLRSGRKWTHYDLKGDLQMQERAARQDMKDAWHSWEPWETTYERESYLTSQPCAKSKPLLKATSNWIEGIMTEDQAKQTDIDWYRMRIDAYEERIAGYGKTLEAAQRLVISIQKEQDYLRTQLMNWRLCYMNDGTVDLGRMTALAEKYDNELVWCTQTIHNLMTKTLIRAYYRAKWWIMFDVLKRYSPEGWPPKKWVSYRFTYSVMGQPKWTARKGVLEADKWTVHGAILNMNWTWKRSNGTLKYVPYFRLCP
jgi:hypothetical protein